MSSLNPRKRGRSRSASPGPNIDDKELSYDEIPQEFFCPISYRFISDPVKIPTSDRTYDRNSVKDSYKPEDIKPDFRMRNTMEEWFSLYDLDPPFKFMSNGDDLKLAANSVMEQRRQDLLCELATEIKCKPSLMTNGGRIWCVATLLSFPLPSASWVATTLSIVAHVEHDNESLIVPTDILSDYSFLDPIARACDGSESEDNEFQSGLINLMYALLVDNPNTSVMAGKLGGIADTLVSYIWPVQRHAIGCYIKLLSTLEILSTDVEICEDLVIAGIMARLFSLLDFGISSVQEIRHNPDKLLASRAMGPEVDRARHTAIRSSFTILDRVCSCSAEACRWIEGMDEDVLSRIRRAVLKCARQMRLSMETWAAGSRVLGRRFIRSE